MVSISFWRARLASFHSMVSPFADQPSRLCGLCWARAQVASDDLTHGRCLALSVQLRHHAIEQRARFTDTVLEGPPWYDPNGRRVRQTTRLAQPVEQRYPSAHPTG